VAAPDDVLLKAAGSIATGDDVDWQGLRRQPLDPQRDRVLGEMEVLERIASFLRNSETLGERTEARVKQNQLPPPHSWAQFVIVDVIGDGGFGVVYRARDTKLQTDVALKLVDLPDGREIRPALVLKEARLLARVRHPNVVAVYGADIVDGRVGIWMELVEGQTLASLLRGHGRLGAHEAALVGIDLCRAIAAVHGAGLVHGDVKTRNVMRESGGRTVLMDFGAGRDLSALHLHRTREGVAGTPLYLAPEVFDGQAPSKLTDIYSLGVLLFHLVTDAYPVNGQTQAEVEDAHRRGERIALRDARPDLPQAFVALVERALNRNPRERFQTAGACEGALSDFLGHAQRPPAAPSTRRTWLAGAAVATALVAGVAGTSWFERSRTRIDPQATTSSPSKAPAAAPAQAPGSYRIEPAFFRRNGGADARLRAGDRLAPGDELFMRLHVSAPTFVYVLNEDDQGEKVFLFPLPGRAVENPVAGGTPIRVPGTAAEEYNWQVSNAGGREHFLIFASPVRMSDLETLFAALPRPAIGTPVLSAPIPRQAIGQLRSVGGLTVSPNAETGVRWSSLVTQPLANGEETADGVWMRQLTLENPGRRP
jgi:serine/threonine-protein kinase